MFSWSQNKNDLLYNDIMVLYIDETENKNYFIVTGLLVDSVLTLEKNYKMFKNSAKLIYVSPKYKSIIFTEFKSHLLDYDYQKIKLKMLESISRMPCSIIYSKYNKNKKVLNQILKERVYVSLLINIIKVIPDKIEVIFDAFNKKDFEDSIKKKILTCKNVIKVISANSEKCHGIQYVDNISSVIRLNSDIDNKYKWADIFYFLLKRMIKEASPSN